MNKNILVVDDTESNIDILLELLDDKYDVMVALDGESALEIANEERLDLILLDIMMPIMDGYEVCQKLKLNENTKDIPIIFITAKTDEDSIEKAYSLGGSDYVIKPFRPKELLAKVNREIQLKNYQEELKLLASTDPMTKLYNRRYFNEISKNILEQERENSSELSIMMMDIDKFKNVNDTYGHSIGDEVISFVADILRKFQRKSDVVCRYGGEEFVMLLPNTSIKEALSVAQRVRKHIEESILDAKENESFKITISIGISQIDLLKETNIEASLNRADKALYKAKDLGRNRVCINF